MEDRTTSKVATGARREDGMALILTLFVLAILLVLVHQFSWSTNVEQTIARNSKDDLKMLFAARGGIAFVKAHLRADRVASPKVDSLREDWADPSLLGTATVRDVSLEIDLEDCERFLNVNWLAEAATKDFAVEALTRLGTKLGVEDPSEAVNRIVDFVDADSEGEFEAGARNGPLLHADELLGMPSMTDEVREMLLGTPPDPETGEGERAGMLDFLTTHGSGLVNINTAPLEVLYALLPDQDAQGAEINKAEALEALNEFRTGAAESETGGATGTSTSTSVATAASTSGAAAGGEAEGEKPGSDFEKVEDLAKIQGLEKVFATQQKTQPQPQPASETKQQQAQKRTLRSFLAVESLDFRIGVTAVRAAMRKRYEIILRRGQEEFTVLLFREVGK